MVIEKDWQGLVKRLVKTEMARNEVTYEQLAERLKALGVSTSRGSLTTQINRGSFSAKLLVQIFKALGSSSIPLE